MGLEKRRAQWKTHHHWGLLLIISFYAPWGVTSSFLLKYCTLTSTHATAQTHGRTGTHPLETLRKLESLHTRFTTECAHVCTLNTAHHLRMYSEFSTPCSILTQDQTWVGHGHPRPHRYATSPSVLFAKFNCCGFRGKQKKLDMNPHIWNVTANVLTPMSYSRHLLSVKAPKGRNGNPIKDVWDM